MGKNCAFLVILKKKNQGVIGWNYVSTIEKDLIEMYLKNVDPDLILLVSFAHF